jgi:uncharacterized coiled-coil DUF342 family protein
MSTTEDLLRQQFNALCAQRDAIIAQAAPLREQRAQILNDARAQEKLLNKDIRVIEKDLFQTMIELGQLTRALGGRQMSGGK